MGLNIRLNEAAVRRVVGGAIEAAVQQAADITAARAKRNIQAAGRIDSSAMYREMTTERSSAKSKGDKVVYLVYTPVEYADYQEFGTGLYGPRGAYIYPTKAKALRFRPKGATAFVFAKRVRGVRPAHFMRDAAKALSTKDFLRASSRK